MNVIIRDEVEPLPSALPAPVRWTIERCLSKDPDRRYDSTRDLDRELRQTRDGLSQTLGLPAAAVGAAPRAPMGDGRGRRPWSLRLSGCGSSGDGHSRSGTSSTPT